MKLQKLLLSVCVIIVSSCISEQEKKETKEREKKEKVEARKKCHNYHFLNGRHALQKVKQENEISGSYRSSYFLFSAEGSAKFANERVVYFAWWSDVDLSYIHTKAPWTLFRTRMSDSIKEPYVVFDHRIDGNDYYCTGTMEELIQNRRIRHIYLYTSEKDYPREVGM